MSINPGEAHSRPLDERPGVDGDPPTHPDHLTKKKLVGAALKPTTPREFSCRQCLSRVTQSKNGDKEYGHKKECDHSFRSGAGQR